MPALTTDEVKDWARPKVEQEMRDRLKDVASIREKHDGSLVNVKGDDADQVRQHNTDLGLLGERLDEVKELEGADQKTRELEERVNAKGGYEPQATNGKARKVDFRDMGTQFAESEALKRFREDGIKGIEHSVSIGAVLPEYRGLDLKGFRAPQTKAILGSDDALATVDTEFEPESRRTGIIVEELFQQANIADLLPQTTIDQPSVPFMRETVNDQGAKETAEGAEAPEASIDFVEDSAPVRKIPVMIPVTEEILEDEQLVRGHVNGRLPLFIRQREDSQLLNGDGEGQNLEGFLNLSGVDTTTSYSIGSATAQDKLESVFSATMRIAENFLIADATVMGLGIWEEIRLAKDKNGNYLIAPATEGAAPRIWGSRVVTNQSMPVEAKEKTPILVGAFAQSSQIWRRRAITLAVSDSHDKNFAKGILVIKATSRVAVTHYRAGGYALVESKA
jgi:HK97 family phage major capsid protein